MTALRILGLIGTIASIGFSTSAWTAPADKLQPGMSGSEMLYVITAGMEAGASCAETRAAITRAVELSNDAAPELVAGLVAREDTGCFDDSWLAQRVEDRLLPNLRVTAIYMAKACVAPFAVVSAAAEGLDDTADAAALTAQLGAILDQGNLALGGCTATSNPCAEAILVAAANSIADEDLRQAVWDLLPAELQDNGSCSWGAVSLFFLTDYEPFFHLHLGVNPKRTGTGARCIGMTGCNGGEDEPDCDPEIASRN